MRDHPSPKSCRGRMRLSVRALMVIVLITGGGLGWVVHRARVQRDAVAAIERTGGYVAYDWQRVQDTVSRDKKPGYPEWIVRLLGMDYFGHVVWVGLFHRGSDLEMIHVGKLSRLEILDLDESAVTDAGLIHLKGLTRLKRLDLRAAKVTDAGLEHLKKLSGHPSIHLGWNKVRISDAALEELQKALPNAHVSR
jgi:internalin A